MNVIEWPLSLSKELIFVVRERQEATMVALESNFGIVATGEDLAELKQQVKAKVMQFFNGKYEGRICIRQFSDIVLDGQAVQK